MLDLNWTTQNQWRIEKGKQVDKIRDLIKEAESLLIDVEISPEREFINPLAEIEHIRDERKAITSLEKVIEHLEIALMYYNRI